MRVNRIKNVIVWSLLVSEVLYLSGCEKSSGFNIPCHVRAALLENYMAEPVSNFIGYVTDVRRKSDIETYRHIDHFPDLMVFAEPEEVELIQDIYNEIGFTAEYKEGNEEIREFYRKKYERLLREGLIVYRKDGESSIMEVRYDLKELVTNSPDMYFFEMDEDGAPELCIADTAGTFVCKYDPETDGYVSWYDNITSGGCILGSRKMGYTHNDDEEYLFQMDEDGQNEIVIEYAALIWPNRYIVSVPGYEERLRSGQIPESMKKKLYYDEYEREYFIRVTKEQYKDLIKGLHDARKQAEEHTVPLSYFIEDIENEEYQSKYNLNYKHKHP